ncbi:MAG: hypothetical protein CL609_00410 [Anaerolineaceae bacterium]|nr:hypothetical protein [Anaerolineaceae bacterium]
MIVLTKASYDFPLLEGFYEYGAKLFSKIVIMPIHKTPLQGCLPLILDVYPYRLCWLIINHDRKYTIPAPGTPWNPFLQIFFCIA